MLRRQPPGRRVAPVHASALTAHVEIPAGGARTIAVTGLFADLPSQPLPDDFTATPDGAARVRVLAAASGSPSTDVRLPGGPALTGLAFGGAGGPVDVPAGPTTVTVGTAAPLPVSSAAGSVHTLLVLDAPGGGLTLRLVQDAAGPALTPVGAVEAGGGGAPAVPGPVGARRRRRSCSRPGAAGPRRRGRRRPHRRPACTHRPRRARAPDGLPVGRRAGRVGGAAVRSACPRSASTARSPGSGLDAAGALVPPADFGSGRLVRRRARPGRGRPRGARGPRRLVARAGGVLPALAPHSGDDVWSPGPTGPRCASR